MEEQRGLFTGVFRKYGLKAGYRGSASVPTVLLVGVRDAGGKLVCDHLWFNMTKGFEALGRLEGGEEVTFEARVTEYKKGYVLRRAGIDERKVDYRLSRPTKVKLVRRK